VSKKESEIQPYTRIIKDGQPVFILNPEWDIYTRGQNIEHYIKNSGIPKDYWRRDLSVINIPAHIKAQAIDFINNINTVEYSLYMFGTENTTGKTTTACAIGVELIKRQHEVYFSGAREFIDALQKTSGFARETPLTEEFFTARKFFKTAEVLILDDMFDKEKIPMWKDGSQVIAEIDGILRYRWSNKMKTIITSNKTLLEMSADFGINLYKLIKRNSTEWEFKYSVEEERLKELDR
jgi:DNA replication protein DnaC